jgi:hypothetical protein
MAVSSWRKRVKETGRKTASLNRKPRKIPSNGLRGYVEKYPDKYLREIAEVFKCGKETIRTSLRLCYNMF